MTVLIISLACLEERRAHSIELMSKHNIDNYYIIEAVDGINEDQTGSSEYSDRMANYYCGRSLSSSEIAIALSHRKAYQYILDHNIDCALIIEDDVEFEADIVFHMNQLNSLTEIDVLFLSHRGNVRRSFWNCNKILGRILAPMVDKPYGTQGYAISKKAAKVFVNETETISRPADHLTADYKALGLIGKGYFPTDH